MKKLRGYTLFVGVRDYFVVTDRKRLTDSLRDQIAALIPVDDILRPLIRDRIVPATCEIKTLPVSGRTYWEISGEGYGGLGGFTDDDSTMVMYL